MLMPADLDLFASTQRDTARESSFLFSVFFIAYLYRRRCKSRSRAVGDKIDARHSAHL